MHHKGFNAIDVRISLEVYNWGRISICSTGNNSYCLLSEFDLACKYQWNKPTSQENMLRNTYKLFIARYQSKISLTILYERKLFWHWWNSVYHFPLIWSTDRLGLSCVRHSKLNVNFHSIMHTYYILGKS